jgi:hypothetical protein
MGQCPAKATNAETTSRYRYFRLSLLEFQIAFVTEPHQILELAPYKQALLQSQKRKLHMAPVQELESATAFHSMFGGSYARFAAIIFNTFEAAVLLLCRCCHIDFPF